MFPSPVPPAPALFNEPQFRGWGVRWLGARGFGGILSEKDSWIPQYNLRNFWRRSIPPVPVGLIEPLIPPRFRKANDHDRLPGSFSYRTEESELYYRNLLAVRYYEENGGNERKLKIWTVNERSKRHYLECFQVEISPEGHPLPASRLLLSDRKLKMTPPAKLYPDAEHFPREPLLEVRTSVWSDLESTTLYLRSPTLLRMLRQDEESPTTKYDLVPIFNRAVKYFAESDLNNGQLAVVDHGGRVWMHDVQSDSPDNPQKLRANDDEIYQRVAFTDHPQLLALSSLSHVETVDARSSAPSRTCCRLWESPVFEARETQEPKRVQEFPPRPAKIRHLEKVPGTANMYVIMTDHAMHLLDDRFPGKTVVHVNHGYGSGTHEMVVSRGVKDEKMGGVVYSLYTLDQFHFGVSHTSIYLHSSGIWSSVAPFHSIGEPHDFNEIVRRGKYSHGERMLPEPTRAFCLMQGIQDRQENHQKSLLIRQQDDGSVWWQTISHDPELTEERKNELERESVRRIRETRESDERWRRQAWNPVYAEGIAEEYREQPGELRTHHHIEVHGITRYFSEDLSQKCSSLIQNSRNQNPQFATEKLPVQPLDDVKSAVCGFRGSHSCENSDYDEANLAQTYSALLSLAILGDDLKRVERKAILETVKKAQRDNGCFWSQGPGSESDMRFVFCAAAICKILDADKEDVIDWKRLGDFLRQSINIDGGIGQAPFDESHGGSTFCAIAALSLSNRLWTEEVLSRKDLNRLIKWAVQKQHVGFHGRAHKPDDSCYAFWIGATLKILNAYHLVSHTHLREFLMISQHPHIGGFCKYPEPGGYSDLLHTYFSIAALSLLGEPAVNPVNPALNVSMRASEHISTLRFD